MNKGKSQSSAKNSTKKEDKVGEINPDKSHKKCNEPGRDDGKDEDDHDDDDNEDDGEREDDYDSENDEDKENEDDEK